MKWFKKYLERREEKRNEIIKKKKKDELCRASYLLLQDWIDRFEEKKGEDNEK